MYNSSENEYKIGTQTLTFLRSENVSTTEEN